MQVIISNLPPETTKAIIWEELQKRNIKITDVAIENAGDPDKITAIISLDTGEIGAAALEKRVNGKYWHGRILSAYALKEFSEK
ncbi:MAG: hypothetical protein GQ581_02405 [Methyloprofundus sp.]|nr:hypothetical protein [Methyloprofundus sp.]